ncbi:diguanylate cyclase domain-containing protein [Thioalkalivibrio sp. ALJ24]|uniref:TackOD1 domain-containing metal-binding protein n=1 Tax=Thioalkalivibrio sp. ALJ24 TaxID=545276 RepID=UPI001E5ABA48|nr:diguanylate cyclase [Thioalkalivibrio sp. ALJ24]
MTDTVAQYGDVSPHLVVLTRQAGLAERLAVDLAATAFPGLEDFDASQGEWGPVTAFVVDADSLNDAAEIVRALRQRDDTRMRLVWLHGEAEAEARALVDGAFNSVDNPRERIVECADRLEAVNGGRAPRSQDEILLALLWSHPGLNLVPVRDWRAQQLYRYPLLEALIEEDIPEFWLRGLRQRRLVEGLELLDRVRLCPGCRHGHLSFVDVCPECDALDIRTEPGLHCFSCGHVGPQRLFQDGGMLRCPNCTAVLRHIGEDYDRPLENHVCGSCQHMFMEGRVLARCLGCGQEHDPDDLEPLAIYRYRLSEAGRLLARTGELGDLYGAFDEINYVNPEHFEYFLDWSLKLRRRHEEIRFGLILLHMGGMPKVIDALGYGRGVALVDSFAERTKALVRSTDLMTRTGEDRIWLLLPQTTASGVDVLAGRLSELLEDIVSDSGITRLGSVYHESSTGMAEAEDAAAVMARLVSRSQ